MAYEIYSKENDNKTYNFKSIWQKTDGFIVKLKGNQKIIRYNDVSNKSSKYNFIPKLPEKTSLYRIMSLNLENDLLIETEKDKVSICYRI